MPGYILLNSALGSFCIPGCRQKAGRKKATKFLFSSLAGKKVSLPLHSLREQTVQAGQQVRRIEIAGRNKKLRKGKIFYSKSLQGKTTRCSFAFAFEKKEAVEKRFTAQKILKG